MMGTHADKTAKTDSPQTVAGSRTQETGVSANGPAAATHQSLKDLADLSRGVNQLKAYQTMADQAVIQRQVNTTGLPDNLKSGIENLSGYSMNDVKVHYNSSQPAQLNAHAYAQGSAIHLAPGQEKHLPHEAWHVVQQKQGRVKPTTQLKGKVAINDDAGLEKEADEMGAKALQMKEKSPVTNLQSSMNTSEVSQLARDPDELETTIVDDTDGRPDLTGSAQGFGAMVGGKKWITKVAWGGVHAQAGEGTGMIARPLGPDHPSGKDSGKSGLESKARAQFLTAITGTSYIQGHLLNDNLGGPAEVRNLTAIPGKPGNSAHSTAVEEPIKAQIDAGKWVYYAVGVTYATKKIREITPMTQQEFNVVKAGPAYANLPGVKPVNLESDFAIASDFTTEWYTYQGNGDRHGPVNRVTIHFPVYHNNERSAYTDDDDNYLDEFVSIGATTLAEQATNGNAAIASRASWLGLDKNKVNRLNSIAPNKTVADYESEADSQWKEEYEDSVDDMAETITYPDRHDNWAKKTVRIPNARRVRKSRYKEYIDAYDSNDRNPVQIQASWDLYKTALRADYRRRYRNEWAAVRDAADQTLT